MPLRSKQKLRWALVLSASVVLLLKTSPVKATINAEPQAGIDELETALRANPNDYRIHFALGRAYEQLGFHGLADEEDEFCEKQGEPFHSYILGIFREKVRSTDYRSADMLYRYVEKHYPSEPSVLLTKALRLHARGHYPQAEKTMRQLLESRAEYEPGTYTYLGQLFLQKQQYKQAIECFDKELAKRPGFEGAIIGKAKALEAMHHYRKAFSLLVDIYQSNPARLGLADTVANCLVGMGDYKTAIDPALLSVAFATKQPDLDRAKRRVQFLWNYSDPKTQREALFSVGNYLDHSADKIPYAKHFHFAMGSLLKKMGVVMLSQDQFYKGLMLEPGHAKALLYLGDMYLEGSFGVEQAKFEKAKDFYGKGLDMMSQPTGERSDLQLQRTFAAKTTRLDRRLQNRHQDFAWRLKNQLQLPIWHWSG